MQKKYWKSFLVLVFSLVTLPAFASNIQNIHITPNGNFLEFSWDPIENSQIDKETNYALQWSKYTSDVRIDKPVSALESLSKDKYRMRGDIIFEKDVYYYARVYTYYREDRQTYLLKGSKILKFKWLPNGNIETVLEDANDPEVVNTSGSTTTAAGKFGNTSAVAYDTSAQISWGSTNENFDNYKLVLSENSDLSNPISEFKVEGSYKKALITGLSPEKKYFLAGYLERSGRNFGKGLTINFTTLPKFDSVKQYRFEKYILKKKKYGKLLSTGEEIIEEVSTSTVTSSSSSTAKKARIAELKRLISKYQSELKKLEGTTTDTSSSGMSLKDRLRNWRSRR